MSPVCLPRHRRRMEKDAGPGLGAQAFEADAAAPSVLDTRGIKAEARHAFIIKSDTPKTRVLVKEPKFVSVSFMGTLPECSARGDSFVMRLGARVSLPATTLTAGGWGPSAGAATVPGAHSPRSPVWTTFLLPETAGGFRVKTAGKSSPIPAILPAPLAGQPSPGPRSVAPRGGENTGRAS